MLLCFPFPACVVLLLAHGPRSVLMCLGWEPAGKRYFPQTKLADIIDAYPYKSGLTDAEQQEQRKAREAFFDFLWGILVQPS